MKTLKVSKNVTAFIMAIAMVLSMTGVAAYRNTFAAVEYGEELATNGNFDVYENSFNTELAETNPASAIDIALGGYEQRSFDCYNSASLNGGRGQFVKTDDGNTYARLYYDGQDTTTFDSMDMWIQPGYMSAGTYTVKADVELIGFSTGDCFAMKYNGADENKQEVFNLTEYNALPDGETEGCKQMQYTFTITEGSAFPATMFWFFHKKAVGIEAHIYNVTYYDSESNAVYCNDFSEPFDKISYTDIPYGAYEDRAYGGIYCSAEGEFNAGYGQLVRARVPNGTEKYYARLYDNDKTSNKDTMSMWLQPGLILKGDYKLTVNFEIKGNQNEQYCEFNLFETSEGKKSVVINNGEALANIPIVNGVRSLEIDYTLDVDQQFNALNIWFWHGNDNVRELRIYDVTVTSRDSGAVVYKNDFSSPFDTETAAVGSDKGYNDAKNSVIVKDGENIALKMLGNDCAFNTVLNIDGVGLYRVEMDIKVSESYTGTLSFFFAAIDMVYNSAPAVVANKKSDFDFLDDAQQDGYVHYSTSILINNFSEPSILSMYTTYTGGGADNFVLIDNISVKKQLDSVVVHETPSTEGLVFNSLVKGGDFEYLAVDYQFVPEPDNNTFFWGSSDYDAPGKIVDLDGNKVLKIAYDSENANKQTNRWASAFVFLDVAEFNLQDVYTLSYKYKYEGKDEFNPEIGLQTTFIGATGVEHLVQYLYYTEWLTETSGKNINEWPYVVTDVGNGWKEITLTFKMDSAFISQVDSIRFLNYNNCDEDVVLYVDDVQFGAWRANQGNVEPPVKQSCSCNSLISVTGISALAVAVLVPTSIMLVHKKRRNDE